jgi:chlorite dismutase
MAALIPIRKTAAWWNLTQEVRRNIFEKESHHIAEGVKYLPSVARQLYHSRDIGEPLDFLTWFEYAPQHSEEFEELVRTLRQTEEWRHVDREIDIRLMREPESTCAWVTLTKLKRLGVPSYRSWCRISE